MYFLSKSKIKLTWCTLYDFINFSHWFDSTITSSVQLGNWSASLKSETHWDWSFIGKKIAIYGKNRITLKKIYKTWIIYLTWCAFCHLFTLMNVFFYKVLLTFNWQYFIDYDKKENTRLVYIFIPLLGRKRKRFL